jgi:transcriptional regulator with XRE-family HTH domain
MDAAELCRARDTLGYTDAKLAADLGLSPSIVTAWTSGRAAVPRHIARDLRWRAALIERDQMLTQSGLPECEWVNAWDAEPVPEKVEARLKRLEALTAHAGACPICRAREVYALEHCPPLPDRPLPLWAKGASVLAGLAA